MAKQDYTHPELAKHLRKLFAIGTPYGWGGLEKHMEKAFPKTIEEMVWNGELIIKDNLIQLPLRGVKRNLSTKKDKEYWKFVKKTAKEVKKWPNWMKGLAPETRPSKNTKGG